MEFALSEEQEILSDSVKKMLGENIDIDLLRNHSKRRIVETPFFPQVYKGFTTICTKKFG